MNAKQTPDSNTKSPVFLVFAEDTQRRPSYIGPIAKALQLKSKYNLRQISIIHQKRNPW